MTLGRSDRVAEGHERLDDIETQALKRWWTAHAWRLAGHEAHPRAWLDVGDDEGDLGVCSDRRMLFKLGSTGASQRERNQRDHP